MKTDCPLTEVVYHPKVLCGTEGWSRKEMEDAYWWYTRLLLSRHRSWFELLLTGRLPFEFESDIHISRALVLGTM